MKKKVIIGSALKDCDKISRYKNKDPNPYIPFTERVEKISKVEIIAHIIILWVVLSVIAISYVRVP